MIQNSIIFKKLEVPLIHAIARLGYGTRGGLYLAIGALAIRGAVVHHHAAVSPRGAILFVADEPLGKFVVGVIILGLAGYALWQFVRALADADQVGRNTQGLLQRFGFIFSGLVYVSLVYVALRVLAGWESGDVTGNRSARDWTARVMTYPLGRWAILITGGVMLGFGLFSVGWQSFRGEFDQQLMVRPMVGRQRFWVLVISRIGVVAQGLVIVVVGAFLMMAACRADAARALGLGGALDAVRHEPYGRFGLVAMGLGLMAYGVYNLLLAWYRPIRLN